MPLAPPRIVQEGTSTPSERSLKLDNQGADVVSVNNEQQQNNTWPSPQTIKHQRSSSAVPVSNQDHLAHATLEGNLEKVISVIEAYTSLFGSNKGFDIVMNFRYDINQRFV